MSQAPRGSPQTSSFVLRLMLQKMHIGNILVATNHTLRGLVASRDQTYVAKAPGPPKGKEPRGARPLDRLRRSANGPGFRGRGPPGPLTVHGTW